MKPLFVHTSETFAEYRNFRRPQHRRKNSKTELGIEQHGKSRQEKSRLLTPLQQWQQGLQGLIIFTIAEVVGAVVWVAAASILALAIGFVVEHYIARNVGQIQE